MNMLCTTVPLSLYQTGFRATMLISWFALCAPVQTYCFRTIASFCSDSFTHRIVKHKSCHLKHVTGVAVQKLSWLVATLVCLMFPSDLAMATLQHPLLNGFSFNMVFGLHIHLPSNCPESSPSRCCNSAPYGHAVWAFTQRIQQRWPVSV